MLHFVPPIELNRESRESEGGLPLLVWRLVLEMLKSLKNVRAKKLVEIVAIVVFI